MRISLPSEFFLKYADFPALLVSIRKMDADYPALLDCNVNGYGFSCYARFSMSMDADFPALPVFSEIGCGLPDPPKVLYK